MKLQAVRALGLLAALLGGITGYASSSLAATPAQRRFEPPVAPTSPGDLGGATLPYQLWPAEVTSADGVVVSGSEQASKAGAAMLAAGGNAVDAAVATAFALGVTEPMTSGLGSETFILIRGTDGHVHAIDGSCHVPRSARVDELRRARAAADRNYVQGYKSVAAPGSLAALAYALEHYGTKRLAEVLAPAIDLADFGYEMSSTAVAEMEILSVFLRRQQHVADLFLKDFTDTWGPGHVFCASDLANTLRRIAESGPDEFYRGRIADRIDADIKRNGGYLRKTDLVRVQAVERQPVRGTYRDLEVIAFPYPGGGASLLEMLHILEAFPKEFLRDVSLDRLHLLIEAARIAWVDNQNAGMLPPSELDLLLADRGFAAERAKLIRFDRALSPSEIGGEVSQTSFGIGTTQVSVVDRSGNVVGLSQTMGAFFGSTVATPGLGFLYNGNLNPFSFDSVLSPDYLRPGRVPRTTMTPAIVLKHGKPLVVLGSAGSERVVPTMVSVISGIADRGLDLCEAVATPRAVWGTNWAEPRAFVELAGEITVERALALEKRGFQGMNRLEFPSSLMDLSAFGGTNAIIIDPQTGMFVGVPDPRRSGVAVAASIP